MMRSARVAPWLFSVLALALCAAPERPAIGGPRLSAKRCVQFSQKMERGQTGVALRLRNRCRSEVSCSIEWKVVCGGGSAGGVEAASMELARGEAREVSASAAACDGDWEVTDVRWTCSPVGDD
jgi:hypothetical protein